MINTTIVIIKATERTAAMMITAVDWLAPVSELIDCDIVIGQTVSWGECCRIKHLPTRLYLAVVNNGSNGFQVYQFNFTCN